MSYYWKPIHQDIINRYYWAYTGVTSGETRNECITELLPVIEHIARVCMRQTGIVVNDENLQDITIKVTSHILPRLNEHKLQAALNYLFLSTKRYCINKQSLRKYYLEDIVDNDIVVDRSLEADYHIDCEDTKREILDALDTKIEHQKQINKTSTLFLINLKEYLITNDFDPRGFNIWVQQKMNISETTYSSIISRVKIRSKMFNEKLIKTKYTKTNEGLN